MEDLWPNMDWTNPEEQVTENFKVKDVLMLHSWNRLGNEQEGANFNQLIILCQKLEQIRTLLGCPMNVHCMFRSQTYNQSQGIVPLADVHSMSLACDFDCNESLTIEGIKEILQSELESLGIRMERGTTTWVHIDLREPGPSGRYFHV